MAEKKKDVTESTEIVVVEVTEELLREKLYEVRGVKVMLDSDLAEIYGYTTKALNQQVKNNNDRFDSEFTFKLTQEEWKDLRSKNLTSSWGGSRHLPNVFTEQGVYTQSFRFLPICYNPILIRHRNFRFKPKLF